jgi:RepB DNA-primase from phage plasmid
MSSRWLQVSPTQANIFVEANPLRSSSQVSHVVPIPTAVIPTSPGKYQIFGSINRFAFEQQHSALKVHSITFGGDSVCTACNRVLRLAGFPNCGHDPACHVTLEYTNDSASIDSDFRLDIPTANAMLWPHAIPSRERPDKHSDSEHDWAWGLHELAHGKDAAKLAPRPSDKPVLICYAQGTVDVASPIPGLIEGVQIGDVVIPLGARPRGSLYLVGVHGFLAGGESMILHSISCRIQNGASHRKHCDTPPLGGNCRDTWELSRGSLLESCR